MAKKYNRKQAKLNANMIRNSNVLVNSSFALGLGGLSYTEIRLLLVCLQQLKQAPTDGLIKINSVVLAYALNIAVSVQNVRWLVKEFKKMEDAKFFNLFNGIYVGTPIISFFKYDTNKRVISVQLSPVFLAAVVNGDEQYQIVMNDVLRIKNSKYGLIIYNLLAKERHSPQVSTVVQSIDDLSQIFVGKPIGEVKNFKTRFRNSAIRAIRVLNDCFADQAFSLSALKNGHTIWGYKFEQIEKKVDL